MAKHHSDSTGALRCFICDQKITSTCFPLVVGVTPYSKTYIPTKIGQLMGEGFMVVVCEDDNLCKRCTSLLHELDRLEVDLNLIKDALTNYLKVKYQLHEEDHEVSTCRDETNILLYNEEESDKSSCKKLFGKRGEIVDQKFKDRHDNIPETLRGIAKSPKKINVEIILDKRLDKRRKKRTTDTSRVLNDVQSSSKNKEYICSLCELRTPDIKVYKTHSCSKYEDTICKTDSQAIHKEVKNTDSAEWMCNICNMFFKEENMLTLHAHTHSHNDMVHHKLQNGQPINKKPNIFIAGVYTCSTCHFKTESQVAYRDHQQLHFQNSSENNISSFKSIQQRSDVQISSSYKTNDNSVDSTEKTSAQTVVSEENACNLQTVPENNRTKECAANILPAKDKETVHMNYKISESQKLSIEDKIPSNELYFCSSCSLVFLSYKLLQRHKTKCHVTPSLRGDSVFTTELISNNFCDIQQGGCSDTNKSSNLHTNGKNITNLFKTVSNQFMQVPNKKYSNLNGTESTSEQETGSVTSNSTTNTKTDCDASQFTAGKVDYTTSGKSEQHVATSHNSHFEKSNKDVLTLHRSQSLEASRVDNNSIPCNFAINKFMVNSRTDMPIEEKGNSEANINYNSNIEDLLDVSYRDMQRNGLVPENVTDNTKQKGCESNSKTDNEKPQLDSCGAGSYQTQDTKDLNSPTLFDATKIGTPQCENCGKFFSSNSKMLYHRDVCSKNLSCKLCNKHFLNMTDLLEHNSEKHQTHEMNHNCMHCSVLFPTKELCLAHQENCDFASCCDECGETFSKVDQLRSHKDTAHRDPHCRYCGKEILKLKTLRNHELRHVKATEAKFECSECKKVFKTKTGLRHHSALHTGQYKFCCDYCGRGFMSRMMMEEHRSKHTKEERYICDVCGRKFCFQSTYWIHRKWHDNPYPYKCNFCGRKFRHSSLLAVHKRKHTGERPYKCPHCPLTFPVGGTLKRHIILHTGVYPYNCEFCKRGFTTRHKFAHHLSKIHGDSKMLNEKSQPNEFKMVIRDNYTAKKENNVEPSAEWQNPDDSGQVDMNFRLGSSAGSVDNFEHLEGAMSCSLVPDDLLVGNGFASRVVEIVLEDTSQAVAAVTVADPEANSLSDLWYQ